MFARWCRARISINLIKQTILPNEYDIFPISETWLDPSTTDTDIQISGYIVFRQDRGTHEIGGGVVGCLCLRYLQGFRYHRIVRSF